jgi:hypothetical protein
MTPVIKQQIEAIKEIIKDNPADATAYVLLKTMVEMIEPTKAKLFMSADAMSILVAKQINLIMDIAISIINFLDIKKANLKG